MMHTSVEIELLTRLVNPDMPNFPPEMARSILDVKFNEEDHARMADLNGKANRGELSTEEDQQLRWFILVSDALAILKSKARLSLKAQNTAA